ncbi:hypothetical protein GCM10008110_00720 [Marinobacter persicus]|nr:hypothetical protein GCM10008110_00720 [Marinobacter persicus]
MPGCSSTRGAIARPSGVALASSSPSALETLRPSRAGRVVHPVNKPNKQHSRENRILPPCLMRHSFIGFSQPSEMSKDTLINSA